MRSREENKKDYRWEEGKKIRNIIDGKGRKSEILQMRSREENEGMNAVTLRVRKNGGGEVNISWREGDAFKGKGERCCNGLDGFLQIYILRINHIVKVLSG